MTQWFWMLAASAAALLILILLIAYLCYRMAFYSPDRPASAGEAIEIPEGEAYEPFRELMENWVREVRAMPREEVEITSFDGLKLRGHYYEYAPDAPLELMFHGYRGSAERDLSGGVERCFKLGRSALIVNQRASIGSEGDVISFGINERRDCRDWLDFALKRFGPEKKIILTGISMGAATVMMMADQTLPPNVIGILADCGYSSAQDIIKTVIGRMGLPPKLAYPFVELGARLFGHFDLDESSPVEALKNSTVPVIFFHGEDDDFVPCEMSRINYETCTSRKMLVTIPGAGHGLCYAVAPEPYLDALREFFGPEGSAPQCGKENEKGHGLNVPVDLS